MRFVLPLLLVLLAAQTAAASDSVYDLFRVPDHRTHFYSFDLRGSASRTSANAPASASINGIGDVAFSATARWLRDSDARQWEAALMGATGGFRRHLETRETPQDRDNRTESSDRNVGESVRADLSLREYPTRLPLGLELGVQGQILTTQTWFRREAEDQILLNGTTLSAYQSVNGNQNRSYEQTLFGSAGLGWGRVRDASAVHVVWLLEQRWLSDRSITRPLTDEERTRLAALVSIRGRYGSAHDRPDKAFWRDVETLLRDAGALAGEGLGAYASLHATDDSNLSSRTGSTRSVGFFVGPRLRVQYQRRTRHEDYTTSWRSGSAGSYGPWTESRFATSYKNTYRSPLVELAAEWHRAIGVTTHADASAWAGTDLRGLRRRTDLGSYLALRHWIGERWLVGTRAAQQRAIVAEDDIDSWTASLDAEVQYFIEDHWSASVLGNAGRSMLEVPLGRSGRSSRIEFSIGWNRGALDAPGLIDPVRPLN